MAFTGFEYGQDEMFTVSTDDHDWERSTGL